MLKPNSGWLLTGLAVIALAAALRPGDEPPLATPDTVAATIVELVEHGFPPDLAALHRCPSRIAVDDVAIRSLGEPIYTRMQIVRPVRARVRGRCLERGQTFDQDVSLYYMEVP